MIRKHGALSDPRHIGPHPNEAFRATSSKALCLLASETFKCSSVANSVDELHLILRLTLGPEGPFNEFNRADLTVLAAMAAAATDDDGAAMRHRTQRATTVHVLSALQM